MHNIFALIQSPTKFNISIVNSSQILVHLTTEQPAHAKLYVTTFKQF